MKNIINKKISTFLTDQKLKNYINEIEININNANTKTKTFGDYSTNIALKISKNLKQNPMIFAEKIKDAFKKDKDFVDVTITNPGFINFIIAPKILLKELQKFISSKKKDIINSKTKINYEFVSANPTGDLHIGHLRNGVVGDVVSRSYEYLGFDLDREYWINDYGNQISTMAESVFFYINENLNLGFELQEPGYKGKDIIEYANYLTKNEAEIFKSSKSKKELIILLQEKGVNYFLNKIKVLLKDLNIKEFKYWTSEKFMYDSEKVKLSVDNFMKAKALYEKDGAYWIKSSERGDDKDRVLIKNDGNFTYMAGDIANHVQKFERKYNLMINLWGSDHHGYEDRILAGMDFLGYDPKKVRMSFINMVQVLNKGEKVKLSKRAGTSVRIIDLLKLVERDVLKYFIIAKSKGQDMVLDLSKIKEQDQTNPYYYVQYAFVRSLHLLEKYKKEYKKIEDLKNLNVDLSEIEKELILKLFEFKETLYKVIEKDEPFILITYQKELCKLFNSFYSSTKIIGQTKNRELKINIVNWTNKIFKEIFDVLGIEPLERM